MGHRDLLAEIELTMVPSLLKPPEPSLSAPLSEPPGGSRQRRFWCSLTQQDVEVEFETKGIPGFRWIAGVKGCTAFEQPEEVACGRRCLEARFRRQWPYALPIADHRRALAR
jgi:hypothetical protein